MQATNLTHHFLIAMPGMADPHFSRSVTYICEHTERGAIGVVINKPIDITLAHLFAQCQVIVHDDAFGLDAVRFGGPVKMECGFVLHQPVGEWKSTLKVDDDIGLTTSRDILEAIAEGHGPHNVLITLGYAGWEAGQLEDEIRQNGWLTVPADAGLIFATPDEQKHTAAMRKLGIRPEMLTDAVGHA